MSISIHRESKEILWQKAWEFVISWLRLYHNIGQKTLLLLSGGSVVNLYKELAKFLETGELDFSFLAIAQVDERFIKIKNEKLKMKNYNEKIKKDINAKAIEETGLWNVCKRRKIPYYLVSQEGTLEKSAEQYDGIIERLFKEYVYKFAVLGIGEDGHTAGILPGYQSVWDKNELVVGYKIDYRQNSPMGQFCQKSYRRRITITPKALQQLDQAIVVAVGEKKKGAIKRAIDGKNSTMINEIPAVVIQKIPKVDLFTDIKI